MSQLNATWSVDTTALEDSNRGYPMTIERGGLYEVWLPLDDHPKPAVAIGPPADLRGRAGDWEVLVDGRLIVQRGGRIFRTGTATYPVDLETELTMRVSQQIAAAEDAKIIKLLSEMENP